METIWRRVFDEKLHVSPEDHPVLMTERPRNPLSDKTYEVRIILSDFVQILPACGKNSQ